MGILTCLFQVISVISLNTLYFCNQKELFKKLDMWKYLRFEIFPIFGFWGFKFEEGPEKFHKKRFQWNHQNILKEAGVYTY